LAMQESFSEALQRKRVISEVRAAELADLSLPHFRRMRRANRGPRFVQLGARRIGYRVGDVLDWIDARVSGAVV
jgi:predicted DNA-binding transcriptional regulator AlpA